MNETANAEKTQLKLVKFVRATREKVFQAWTNPQHVSRWFAPGAMTVPSAEVDARVGGSYRIQMKNADDETFTTTGVYKEIVPNEKLVFSWGWEGPERYESLVTVKLMDKDDGTEITLIHERLQNTESTEKHTQGWQGCLANLAARIDQIN